MERLLEGKTAVITGARRGIGLATLKLFAENGASVWAIIRSEDREWLEATAQLSSAYNVFIKPVYADISDSTSLKAAVKEIFADKLPVDILVNAAGVTSPDRSFAMTPLEDIKKLFNTNFFGALELSQLVLRKMMRRGSGSIINVTSIAAFGEDTSQLEYAASKAALECATEKMAAEVSPFGIRVNSVAPGWTATDMTRNFETSSYAKIEKGLPMGRFAKPEEIAQGILFLASEKASFISGSCLRIDGGAFKLKNFIG